MNFVILGILLNELSKDLEAGYIDSSLRKATEEVLTVASQMVRRPACPSAVQYSALKWATESMPRPPVPGVMMSSGLPFHFS